MVLLVSPELIHGLNSAAGLFGLESLRWPFSQISHFLLAVTQDSSVLSHGHSGSAVFTSFLTWHSQDSIPREQRQKPRGMLKLMFENSQNLTPATFCESEHVSGPV